ncbi:uncharacterized protein BT62DRAFT_1080911 [Guyanagaster necrorhizus]|uniref:Fungal-type protein kinase domain-containing protein n=1 Tax=Guyanagaster necrorhizus TaxID=856835 RepID=A0A9P7VI80_9AGAR|nr:uncharacterized protein BT62DRAFT_1080911 [Guyanagaster necrorhizus MCA 3950]KAG7440414.1 hypothetical protein BT62DRAFT_1080911 [Guyanagaster necrorhizus MCA 3950]
MPVELFLDDLMGSSDGPFTLRSPGHLHDSFQSIQSPAKYDNEREYAEAVVNVIQLVMPDLMPLFKLVLGKEYKDADLTTRTVTDAFMYPSDVDTRSHRTQWSKTELCPDEWVSQTDSSKDCRGQLAGYVATTLNVQHRKYLFSLNLDPDGIRFFRWERTYTIVSRAFNLSTEEGKYLVGFLYRFSTLTPIHLSSVSVSTSVRWRTLTVEVGHPLKKFKSSKQLTRVVYEAFLAHEGAFTLREILHCDVSGRIILIVYDKKAPEDVRSWLNDWDKAIRMDDLDKPARQVERTGTWQFMSIALLRERDKKHEQ